MAEGDAGDAIFEEIEQVRPFRHARQGGIVAHHENRLVVEPLQQRKFVNLDIGAETSHGGKHDQAFAPRLWPIVMIRYVHRLPIAPEAHSYKKSRDCSRLFSN